MSRWPFRPGCRVAGVRRRRRQACVCEDYLFILFFSSALSPFSIRMTRTHARADYTAYSYFSTLVLATIYPIPYHDCRESLFPPPFYMARISNLRFPPFVFEPPLNARLLPLHRSSFSASAPVQIMSLFVSQPVNRHRHAFPISSHFHSCPCMPQVHS